MKKTQAVKAAILAARLGFAVGAALPAVAFAQAPSAVDANGISQKALTVPGITVNGPTTNKGALTVSTLSTPTTPTFTTCTGVLTTGTYYYRVSATNAAGETLASTEGSKAIVSVTGLGVRGTWPQVTGATGYKFYGRTTGAEQLIATITSGTTLTYCDAGSISPSGALPSRNATADSTMAGNLAVTGTVSGTLSPTDLTVTGNTQLGDASTDTFLAYPATLSLAKEINHTLGPVTSTTSNAAGANLTIAAGTATSGGSGNAGTLTLNAGADGSATGGTLALGAANTLHVQLGSSAGSAVTDAYGALTMYPTAAATGGATLKNSVDLAFDYNFWTGSASQLAAGYTLRTVPSSAATSKGDLSFLDAGTTERARLVAGASKLLLSAIDTISAGTLTIGGSTATGVTITPATTITGGIVSDTVTANTAATALTLKGNVPASNLPFLIFDSSATQAGGRDMFVFKNNGSTEVTMVQGGVMKLAGSTPEIRNDQAGNTQGLRLTGRAGTNQHGLEVGSISAINGTGEPLRVYSDFYSTLVFDVDKTGKATFAGNVVATGRHTSSDSSEAFGAWSGHAIGLTSNGDVFDGPFFASSAWTVRRVACSSNVAGSGGSTGFVIRIRNVTDSTTLCTLAATSCNTGSHSGFQTDCNVAALSGKHYRLEVDSSSDCAVYPTDTICNVQMAQ